MRDTGAHLIQHTHVRVKSQPWACPMRPLPRSVSAAEKSRAGRWAAQGPAGKMQQVYERHLPPFTLLASGDHRVNSAMDVGDAFFEPRYCVEVPDSVRCLVLSRMVGQLQESIDKVRSACWAAQAGNATLVSYPHSHHYTPHLLADEECWQAGAHLRGQRAGRAAPCPGCAGAGCAGDCPPVP